MFSSSIDDHMFQEVPRNSSQLQCTPQTRPSLSIPNSSAPPPGILDMSFNRRSLDWSELQQFSPHWTLSDQQSNLPPTASRSPGDIHSQLSDWNFPSQPPVPPRLVLWGPFNKTEQSHFHQSAFSSEAYPHHPPSASHPLTPPPHGSKTPKRGRQGCFPSACPPLVTPPMPSKRPRTAEKEAYEFPPPPRYTAYHLSAYPTPMASPSSQNSTFYANHSMAEESLSISPFSSRFESFPQASPADLERSYHQAPTSAHSDFPYAQLSPSSSSTCNYGYYPDSPISPTTPLSSPPLWENSSPFSTSTTRCHQLNFQNPQYPNVWSLEWHQRFNQFRYQN
ncbi:hypothetical protein PGT21_010314 [Puccinia graminis f. sp. tritici]|uniref:Uncharacterized protein n=1 Tax=Puccinia graminis f. sp. tritici TaxID=56615 RepID=A0A5B0LLX9_PUCGR|nr:hypothetical protein PGT21_010314 [Puccinia graminis f. sp. tritici]KAA1068101.1 hypothetical protein PGTUg99_016364 [Puccinia graminis f. sp. tritici]